MDPILEPPQQDIITACKGSGDEARYCYTEGATSTKRHNWMGQDGLRKQLCHFGRPVPAHRQEAKGAKAGPHRQNGEVIIFEVAVAWEPLVKEREAQKK